MPSLIQRIDLSVGQFDKEILINDNSSILEAFVHPVLQVGLNTPPGSPNDLDSYIIGTAPTGAWTGLANHWTVWLNGGWVAVSAITRLRVYDLDSDNYYTWDGVAWIADTGSVASTPFIPNETTLTASHTIILSDHGKHYPCTGTFTQTLPSGLTDGFQIYFDNIGVGIITISGTLRLFTSAGGYQSATSVEIKGMCHCRQIGGDIWRLVAEEFDNII